MGRSLFGRVVAAIFVLLSVSSKPSGEFFGSANSSGSALAVHLVQYMESPTLVAKDDPQVLSQPLLQK